MSSAQKKSHWSRPKGGWKGVQSNARISKGTKLALVVLGLLVGFLIVSNIIRFTQKLIYSQKGYLWKGDFNINLLVRSSDISLISYNPKDESVKVVKIPDETFLEVPNGFGFWQVRSVYELGDTQTQMGGNRLLKDALISFLAVPIDGYIDITTFNNTKDASELIDILRRNVLSGFDLIFNAKTDMAIWELIQLKYKLLGVRFDKIDELGLSDLLVSDKEKLPDGTVVLKSDPVKIDEILEDLSDPVISNERKSIAVLNATDHPQLAGKAARMLNNLGANVIITSNALNKIDKTKITGDESLTLKRLRQIFNLDCQNNLKCDNIVSSEDEEVFGRAQIVVMLGEDYFQKP